MGARPRVWVSQPLPADIVGRLAAHCEVDMVAAATTHAPGAIAAALHGADGALVTVNDRIGAAELAHAPRLRAIANIGVGYDNLDIAALDEAKTRLVALADGAPEVLYPEGDGAFEFERTVSRLNEMSSQDWLDHAEHRD